MFLNGELLKVNLIVYYIKFILWQIIEYINIFNHDNDRNYINQK
jgi:hypothetical protein